jgi:hypothetical protein
MLSNEQGTDAATSMWVITSCDSVSAHIASGSLRTHQNIKTLMST